MLWLMQLIIRQTTLIEFFQCKLKSMNLLNVNFLKHNPNKDNEFLMLKIYISHLQSMD